MRCLFSYRPRSRTVFWWVTLILADDSRFGDFPWFQFSWRLLLSFAIKFGHLGGECLLCLRSHVLDCHHLACVWSVFDWHSSICLHWLACKYLHWSLSNCVHVLRSSSNCVHVVIVWLHVGMISYRMACMKALFLIKLHVLVRVSHRIAYIQPQFRWLQTMIACSFTTTTLVSQPTTLVSQPTTLVSQPTTLVSQPGRTGTHISNYARFTTTTLVSQLTTLVSQPTTLVSQPGGCWLWNERSPGCETSVVVVKRA
jgi:hypothetical protein